MKKIKEITKRNYRTNCKYGSILLMKKELRIRKRFRR